MDAFFLLIEESALARFWRETNSIFAFPTLLVLHAAGMALLVGAQGAIALRVLGLAPGVPLPAMARFVPFARIGLGVNVFSGLMLLVCYPTKALTNPLFYAKLSFIACALYVFAKLGKTVFAPTPDFVVGAREKRLAILLLVLWAGTIFAGRFLAYTYTRLTVYH